MATRSKIRGIIFQKNWPRKLSIYEGRFGNRRRMLQPRSTHQFPLQPAFFLNDKSGLHFPNNERFEKV